MKTPKTPLTLTEPKDPMTIDMNHPRSTLDNITHVFGIEGAKDICAWIRLISEVILKQGKTPMTPMMVHTMYMTHMDSINWALKRFPSKCPTSVKAAFLWTYPTDPIRVDGIAEKFITGANLDPDDPMFLIRKQFAFTNPEGMHFQVPEGRPNRTYQVILILKGISLCLDNQKVRRISVGTNSLPTLVERFKPAWDAEEMGKVPVWNSPSLLNS